MWKWEQDSNGSGWTPIASPYESGSELHGSVNNIEKTVAHNHQWHSLDFIKLI
jgi:hypothetical protein